MKWSYGITSHALRATSLLPTTMASLKKGGFEDPIVFVDQSSHLRHWDEKKVCRHKPLGVYGNFVLSLWELYLRNPMADRYALFQDDVLCCRNLRQYLERCPDPHKGYWNLYLWPCNVKEKTGWTLSDQWGRGALGLVFNNEAMRLLLSSTYFVNHPLNSHIGHKSADKAVVESFKLAHWREFVHNPGLIQHNSTVSLIPGKKAPDHWRSPSFVGEDFDALSLLEVKV